MAKQRLLERERAENERLREELRQAQERLAKLPELIASWRSMTGDPKIIPLCGSAQEATRACASELEKILGAQERIKELEGK